MFGHGEACRTAAAGPGWIPPLDSDPGLRCLSISPEPATPTGTVSAVGRVIDRRRTIIVRGGACTSGRPTGCCAKPASTSRSTSVATGTEARLINGNYFAGCRGRDRPVRGATQSRVKLPVFLAEDGLVTDAQVRRLREKRMSGKTLAAAAAAAGMSERTAPQRHAQVARVGEVRKWSTIRIGSRIYSVPSRLIGHTVEARQHPSTVEVLYGGRVLCTMPRRRAAIGSCFSAAARQPASSSRRRSPRPFQAWSKRSALAIPFQGPPLRAALVCGAPLAVRSVAQDDRGTPGPSHPGKHVRVPPLGG